MTKYSNNKDINKSVKELIRNGWQPLTKVKGKHLKILAPNGIWLTVPTSPSDVRAVTNFKKQARKITGIDLGFMMGV